MKESILISILIIIIYIFFISNKTNLVSIEKNGNKMMVRNTPDKEESAILLGKLIDCMYKVRDHIVTNKTKYTDFIEYIELMDKNFNRKRTNIYETSLDSNFTSYSVNKGEEIVFCLRCKYTLNLHTLNLLVYVAIHEMGHTACPEIGHPPLFNKIFRFILEEAVKLNVYEYENYYKNPVEYCGMTLYSNILN